MHISDDVNNAIALASKQTGVDPTLLAAIGYIESGLNIDTKDSPTSVRGIYQIQGSTWDSIHKGRVAYSKGLYPQALTAAMLIAKLQRQYGSAIQSPAIDLVAIGYNGGEGVANGLIGRPITYANIVTAIRPFHGQKGFPPHSPNKAREIFNYPIRLKNAYNRIAGSTVFTVTDASIASNVATNNTNKETAGKQGSKTGEGESNNKKGFFVKMMGANAGQINNVCAVADKVKMPNTKLVKRVKSGLVKIKTAQRKAG